MPQRPRLFNFLKYAVSAISLAAVPVGALFAAGPSVSVSGLRCEYDPSPLTIDTPHPRLSWRMTTSARGQRQTAYEV